VESNGTTCFAAKGAPPWRLGLAAFDELDTDRAANGAPGQRFWVARPGRKRRGEVFRDGHEGRRSARGRPCRVAATPSCLQRRQGTGCAAWSDEIPAQRSPRTLLPGAGRTSQWSALHRRPDNRTPGNGTRWTRMTANLIFFIRGSLVADGPPRSGSRRRFSRLGRCVRATEEGRRRFLSDPAGSDEGRANMQFYLRPPLSLPGRGPSPSRATVRRARRTGARDQVSGRVLPGDLSTSPSSRPTRSSSRHPRGTAGRRVAFVTLYHPDPRRPPLGLTDGSSSPTDYLNRRRGLPCRVSRRRAIRRFHHDRDAPTIGLRHLGFLRETVEGPTRSRPDTIKQTLRDPSLPHVARVRSTAARPTADGRQRPRRQGGRTTLRGFAARRAPHAGGLPDHRRSPARERVFCLTVLGPPPRARPPAPAELPRSLRIDLLRRAGAARRGRNRDTADLGAGPPQAGLVSGLAINGPDLRRGANLSGRATSTRRVTVAFTNHPPLPPARPQGAHVRRGAPLAGCGRLGGLLLLARVARQSLVTWGRTFASVSAPGQALLYEAVLSALLIVP